MKEIPEYRANSMFSELPAPRYSLTAFAGSYVLQIVAVALLMTITFATPTIVQKQYQHIELAETPKDPEAASRPAPRPRLLPEPPKLQAPVFTEPPKIRTPQEFIPAPQVKTPDQALPKVAATPLVKPQYAAQPTKAFDQIAETRTSPKVSSVQTNQFGGSSATPTLHNKTAAQVQTGGFGSPNGFPVNPNSHASKPNVAATGSWDLPQGAGYGNGTGGARGARGTIASTSGFGNGIATDGGHGGHGHGNAQVQTTSFGNAGTPTASGPRQQQAEAARPTVVPVSIQSKPKPSYTSEARELRVEGEVLLEVNFTATGQVRVVRVVRGLGHGLDEAAVRAAQGIRFTPAQRDGHAVDSTATLHIVFQLS